MNLDQKLFLCEAMLARLNAAMATAEAEARHSCALEDHLRQLLDQLGSEPAQLDRTIAAAAVEDSRDPAQGPLGAQDDFAALPDLHERMTRVRAVQGRLLLLLNRPSDGESPQHP